MFVGDGVVAIDDVVRIAPLVAESDVVVDVTTFGGVGGGGTDDEAVDGGLVVVALVRPPFTLTFR